MAAMTTESDISFHEYLQLCRRQTKNIIPIDSYDDFLLKIWDFFSFRAAAEDAFRKSRHTAYSVHGPLPLSWEGVKDVLHYGGPPEHVLTQIAKRRYENTEHLIRNLRKVLRRIREKEPIGRVQQIDAQCLRWLTRQPGRSHIEKAGLKQEILAVTRVENYNTLENRVLKDFMLRALSASRIYLRRYKEQYVNHATLIAVTKFQNLCLLGLSDPVMESVQPLHELPQPNYVLQQDVHYSQVWKDYCKLLRQDEVAEKLWEQRSECLSLYQKIIDGIPLHCSPKAKYHAPLWFNELDGRKPLIDKPYWRNEEGTREISNPLPQEQDVVIVNLATPWDERDELVYGLHENAKPYIQNPHRPNAEPQRQTLRLDKIHTHRDATALKDYFEQLWGVLGGNRWIVLIPDDWDSHWLEQIIRCCPLPRNKVFLLWRSIAAALGRFQELQLLSSGDFIVVVDSDNAQNFCATKLLLCHDTESNVLLPQRASYQLHNGDRYLTGDRYKWNSIFSFASKSRELIFIGKSKYKQGYLHTIPNIIAPTRDADILEKGVQLFLQMKEKGKTSYFDELESMSVVGQRNEKIISSVLVEGNVKFKGGTTEVHPIPENLLQIGEGQNAVQFFFHIGQLTQFTKLHTYTENLHDEFSANCNIPLSGQIEVSPGQGIAITTLTSKAFDHPLCLDYLAHMNKSEETIHSLEERMPRSFPPSGAIVEAFSSECYQSTFWGNAYAPTATLISVKDQVIGYIHGNVPLAQIKNDAFAHAQRKTEHDLVYGESKLHLLDRRNIFGNCEQKKRPSWLTEDDENTLLEKLIRAFPRNREKCLRLLAWTYRGNNPQLKPIINQVVSAYEQCAAQGTGITAVEVSFLSNLLCEMSSEAYEGRTLRTLFTRIKNGYANGNDFRLFYNLFQFDQDMFSKFSFSTSGALDMVDGLLRYLKSYRENGNPTNYMSAIRSFLYFLRIREVDSSFLRGEGFYINVLHLNQSIVSRMSSLYEKANAMLSLPFPNENDIVHMTRTSLRKFLNGEGTLKDVVNIA